MSTPGTRPIDLTLERTGVPEVLPEGPQEPPARRHPNISCLMQVLGKLGFHHGLLRPAGFPCERVILSTSELRTTELSPPRP